MRKILKKDKIDLLDDWKHIRSSREELSRCTKISRLTLITRDKRRYRPRKRDSADLLTFEKSIQSPWVSGHSPTFDLIWHAIILINDSVFASQRQKKPNSFRSLCIEIKFKIRAHSYLWFVTLFVHKPFGPVIFLG